MDKVTFAVKLDAGVLESVRKYCKKHGIKSSFFVEKALINQLEREEIKEDLFDFKRLRHEEGNAISFEEYLKRKEG